MQVYYVVKSLKGFWSYYHKLKAEDLILMRVPLKDQDTGLFLDLTQRGVIAYPSFLSQLLSQSKCLQAEILKEFMPPFTKVIRAKVDLLRYMEELDSFKGIVVKKNRANCGLGIHLFRDLEEVFNFAGTPVLDFPFVIQPFFQEWFDLRVIILGDFYWEAYHRENSQNFRQNLFFGGKSFPYQLSSEELDFCRRIMKRGGFPQAHLDLAYIDGKGPYLSEINLKGGLKGAKITPDLYEKLCAKLEEAFFTGWAEIHQPYQVI